ncbi:DUF4012 domain-containing protein [Candidatus Gracilibacteria bacterium]|nr:DUF4012 domain-containing protein [Candidatus Gracilibacteria bacterium]
MVFENVFEGKSFTTDLQIFFSELDNLIIQTESLWSDFGIYRTFLSIFGNQKAQQILSSIDEGIKLLKILNNNQDNILDLLGHYTTKQIVIFNQNTGEARSTGGFYGSYLPLTISQGKITVGQSQSIYWIDGSKNPVNYAHPAYSYYSYGKERTLTVGSRDLNFTPCFEVTGSLIEQEFSTSDNGYTIDHLLMITPQFIQNLLPLDFVLNVDGIGPINRNNFFDEIERLTSLSFATNSNPKYNISNIFKSLLDSFESIVNSQGVSKTLNTIIDSIQSRDMMMWFKNPSLIEFSNLSIWVVIKCVIINKKKILLLHGGLIFLETNATLFLKTLMLSAVQKKLAKLIFTSNTKNTYLQKPSCKEVSIALLGKCSLEFNSPQMQPTFQSKVMIQLIDLGSNLLVLFTNPKKMLLKLKSLLKLK